MSGAHRSGAQLTVVVALLLVAGAASAVVPRTLGPFRFSSPRRRVWSSIAPPSGDLGEGAATGAVKTVPFFTDSFVYADQTFTYDMVGTDPRLSHRRTVVPVVIVPLRFVFAGGQSFDPGKTTAKLRRSPLFRRARFSSGTTQYGDAVQRAEFWTYTHRTRYHVLLGHPAAAPTVVVTVPATAGSIATSQLGGSFGLIDETFFLDQVVPAVINQLRLPPTKLIVLWSSDVALQPSGGGTGIILGEHDAGTDQAQTRMWTFAWASWNTPDVVPENDTDVAALSHEISEWYNDPFGTNVVPPWESPPAYPCNPLLEVGDPLAGTTFVEHGYHLQDEAFLSWFARETPSIGMDGRYSFLGTLTAPPAVCTMQ